MDRRSGRNDHHYERCTLTVVTNLTRGYAGYGKVVRLVAGVQLHGSSVARSSRLLMRGSRVQSGKCTGGVRLSSGDGSYGDRMHPLLGSGNVERRLQHNPHDVSNTLLNPGRLALARAGHV